MSIAYPDPSPNLFSSLLARLGMGRRTTAPPAPGPAPGVHRLLDVAGRDGSGPPPVAARACSGLERGCEIQRAFAQYVPPGLIERLMANPDLLNLGGETRDVTVLFADIRGFTAIAEQMRTDPQRLTRILNAIMSPLSDLVIAYGGTIDKYMGDCVMAFWGAPLDDPNHAQRAFGAAQAMLGAMPGINRLVGMLFGDEGPVPEVQIGVGLNTGDCVVGNMGCQKRFDYSVIGDPVNVASRLEGLCKVYDTSLLVGEATARRLPPDAGLREIDRIAVRGRDADVGVFAIV